MIWYEYVNKQTVNEEFIEIMLMHDEFTDAIDELVKFWNKYKKTPINSIKAKKELIKYIEKELK